MSLAAWAADGREVAVVGLGRSGVAAATLLRSRGIPVFASDSGETREVQAGAEAVRGLGAAVEVGGHDLARIGRAVGLVLSPGVPPQAPPVLEARRLGVEIRAEIDVALEAMRDVPYIGVTGTNGKSTTTALAAHLLAAAGHRAIAAGNIGTPLSAVAISAERPSWLALEFSSFQLHDAPRVDPRAGVLTNLSPDHLDRYDTIESYYGDKALFFRNAGPDSIWVVNADDEASREMTRGVAGTTITFSVRERADAWWDRERGWLMLGETPLLARDEFGLLGDHNVANALAAALAVHRVASVSPEILAGALRTFSGLPHRLEVVGEVRGVRWINDSKATNLGSTEVAVLAQRRPFVLLLGGRHKGESYRRLTPSLRPHCVAVVAFGESAPLVAADLGDTLRVERAGALADAVARAALIAVPGDTVLLSPACSSYDMFRNYEERGDTFRRIVEAM